MVGADLALAALINRCANAYETTMPPYMTFREHTHIAISGFGGRMKDIDRQISVRVADDYAVMQDLPQGATRVGSAFPVIPFFDPFSTFSFSYFANAKRLDIDFVPGQPYVLTLPPADPNVDMVVPYFSWFAPAYAPDSTDDALHLLIDPTPRTGKNFYISDVQQDAKSGLLAHVTMKDNASDMTIGLDYATVDNHWVITHGTFSSTQSALGITFKATADTTYTDFTFPTLAPDPRISGTPRPSPSPSANPTSGGTP